MMNKGKLKLIYSQGKYDAIIDYFVQKDPNLYVLLLKQKYSEELEKLRSKYEGRGPAADEDVIDYLINNKIEEEKLPELKKLLIALSNDNSIVVETVLKNSPKRQYFFPSEEELALWLINNN